MEEYLEEYYTIEECTKLLTKSKEMVTKIKELEANLRVRDQKIKELEDKIRQFAVIVKALEIQTGLPSQNN